jgi:16S rRNA (guanine527-N7)-methyltransferase
MPEDDIGKTRRLALIKTGLAAMGIPADSGDIARFAQYLSELERWNARFGFIKADGDELVSLHLLDALAGLNLLTSLVPAGSILDFGSGAGFPGLPLAILMPRHRFVLCERKSTEAAFLSNISALLNLTHVAVTDNLATQERGMFQAVVCRAVTSLKELFINVRDCLAPDGILFAYKGKREKIDEEIEELAPPGLITQVYKLALPGAERERHIVVVLAPGK